MRELELAPVWRYRSRQIGAPPAEGAGPLSTLRGHCAVEAPYNLEAPHNLVPPEKRRATILKMDWIELRAAVAACTACALHTTRSKTVFGVGDERASWLLVGEGPGADEDRQGEPFVGQAGKLLDAMLAAIGLQRGNDVYIANIVKCRPPKNRNPEPNEAVSCEPYLTRQIELIQPKLIVALGKVAARNMLGSEASIASLRGKLHRHAGIPIMVTYHPAYLLRNPADKARAWEDLCFARAAMRALSSATATQ